MKDHNKRSDSISEDGCEVDTTPCNEALQAVVYARGLYSGSLCIPEGRSEGVLHNVPDLSASRWTIFVRWDYTWGGNALQQTELSYTSLGHVWLHSIEEG